MSKFKLKLISLLISVSVFLLLLNVALEYFIPNNQVKFKIITFENFSDSVKSVSAEYALDKQFVKIIKKKSGKKNTPEGIAEILLPEDISAPFFLRDLLLRFNEPEESTFVKKSGGRTEIKIYLNKKEKFRVYLKTLKNVRRLATRIKLLLVFEREIDSNELKRFVNLTFPLNFLIIPSKNNYLLKDYLLSTNKKFGILLNDYIEDNRYLLKKSSIKAKLKNSVSSIIYDFKEAKYFFIDEKSNLYNSVIANFLFDEFSRRKIQLSKLWVYPKIFNDSREEVISRFKFFERSFKGKGVKIILISPESLDYLIDYFPVYFKKGNVLEEF